MEAFIGCYVYQTVIYSWQWVQIFLMPAIPKKTGMPVLTTDPRSVGPDLIVDAVTALELYGTPCIAVDFGTATTFSAVSAAGEYLGHAIAPGIEVSLDALASRAARLSRIELADPGTAIGKNTVQSMQAGALYGFAGQVDGLVDRITAEPVIRRHAQPWMLADYDTVVFEQICDFKTLSPRFQRALVAWVAAGHKLIIHDSDKCGGNTIDYSWLPYKIKTDIPGAMGAPGSVLRILENNWMTHTLRARPGFDPE